MIYQTDLHCSKGNFSYFMEVSGTLYCIGSTEVDSFWELSDSANIDPIDCNELTIEQFLTKKHYSKCKNYLTEAFIKAIAEEQDQSI